MVKGPPVLLAAMKNSPHRSAERHAGVREGSPDALGAIQAAGRPPTATLAFKNGSPKGIGAFAQGARRAVPVEERVAIIERVGERVADPDFVGAKARERLAVGEAVGVPLGVCDPVGVLVVVLEGVRVEEGVEEALDVGVGVPESEGVPLEDPV
jgi:hypothetical protein